MVVYYWYIGSTRVVLYWSKTWCSSSTNHVARQSYLQDYLYSNKIIWLGVRPSFEITEFGITDIFSFLKICFQLTIILWKYFFLCPASHYYYFLWSSLFFFHKANVAAVPGSILYLVQYLVAGASVCLAGPFYWFPEDKNTVVVLLDQYYY